jgi:hypothetical protein
MKARIKIPAGWRRLRAGARLRKGDRMFSHVCWEWLAFANISQCAQPVFHSDRIIRRVKRRAAKWTPRGYIEIPYSAALHMHGERAHRMFCHKNSRQLLTYNEWMAAPFDVDETRFFVRKSTT